jgi:uncharacterized membrane protein
MTAQYKQTASIVMALLIVLSGLFSVSAQAGVVSTQQVITENSVAYDKQALEELISSDDMRSKLVDMGVSPDVVEKRINSMTPIELAELNQNLEETPAGQGALGILALVFVAFMITDAMCATDVFDFVHCSK